MRDADEDIWVRRHIPGTIAQIPSQKSVDVLVGGARGNRRIPPIQDRIGARAAPTRAAEPDVPSRTDRGAHDLGKQALFHLPVALPQPVRQEGTPDRLAAGRRAGAEDGAQQGPHLSTAGLIYPWKDIAAAEWTLQHGDPRSRASASEYLDNVLSGQLRKRIMPLLEDLPVEEKVRRGNVLIKSRPRDVEESLLQLINDDDQVVAAAAIDVVRQTPDLGARRRHRARAGASRRARLVRLRGGLVGARRKADAGGPAA